MWHLLQPAFYGWDEYHFRRSMKVLRPHWSAQGLRFKGCPIDAGPILDDVNKRPPISAIFHLYATWKHAHSKTAYAPLKDRSNPIGRSLPLQLEYNTVFLRDRSSMILQGNQWAQGHATSQVVIIPLTPTMWRIPTLKKLLDEQQQTNDNQRWVSPSSVKNRLKAKWSLICACIGLRHKNK
jgi:hypothetical protein